MAPSSHAQPLQTSKAAPASRALKGRDLISIGIFTAIYFVINFAFMLCGGIHPLLWVLMPIFIALFTGIPFMLMCAKVQKPGAVLIMGLITALIYFATGSFTPFILGLFAVTCVVAEVIRAVTHYGSFKGNTVAFAFFGLGMCGSPLPIWAFRESFFAQIASQGMSAEYISTLDAVTGMPMLFVMVIGTFVAGFIGAYVARVLFKKHFEKAGLV